MDRSSDDIRVVHVDDDSEFLAVASERLQAADERISVRTVADPVAALDELDDVDCVVSDYRMPELDGLELFEAVRSDYPDLPFFLFTDGEAEATASEAISVGVTDYLEKGDESEQYTLLANRVCNAVQRVTAQRAAREASKPAGGETGNCEANGTVDWHRAVVDTMSEGVYVIDADYRARFVNYRVADVSSTSARDWSGRSLSYLAETDVLSRAEVASVEAGVDAVVDGEADEVRVELEPTILPGADVIELRLTPMVAGGETLALGTTRVVTDRIEREAKLQRTSERYRTLIDNFPNGGVFTFDEDLRYTLAGGEELAGVGLSSDEVEGATPQELFPAAAADELETYFHKALAGEQHTFEQQYRGSHYRIHTLPVGDEDITAGMAVSQNVTERVEQRRELERQNERLEEFTSVVSHDLRNPMTVLNGALRLAEETGESEHFERGHRAVDRMDRLVTDLRTLAKQGDRVTDLEPVGLSENAVAGWDTVETGEATLRTDAATMVMADEGRLRQLFENLFRNAVEHGGPDVTVRVGSFENGFFVADDGPGVAPEDRDQIFESGYSTSEEGTGFGLAIVSEIASAHGWTVEATESTTGGARFDVTGVDLAE
jgi:PAS domain S-box-containing protein